MDGPIAEFFWKMQKKNWYSILELDAMPLSRKNLLLSKSIIVNKFHSILEQKFGGSRLIDMR